MYHAYTNSTRHKKYEIDNTNNKLYFDSLRIYMWIVDTKLDVHGVQIILVRWRKSRKRDEKKDSDKNFAFALNKHWC